MDFDNVDGYANHSGFPLTPPTSSASTATSPAPLTPRPRRGPEERPRGPEAGAELRFRVNEQCFQYRECAILHRNFIRRGKPVFQVEYRLRPGASARARKLGFSSLFKRLDLGAYQSQSC